MNGTSEKNITWWTNWWQFGFLLLYPLSFVYFFVIGFHTRQRRWQRAGVVYMVLLLAPLLGIGSFSGSSVKVYLVSIAHALLTRKKYLKYLESVSPPWKNSAPVLVVAGQAPTQQSVAPFAQMETSIPARNPVKAIQDMNAAISDEIVSVYLRKIERILTDIFKHLEKYPEKRRKISELEKYYLPETISLLEKYRELSSSPARPAHVKAAMKEIEETLVAVIRAFQKLYEDLLKDVTFEISTDVQVLKDVFAQNGLLRSTDDLQPPAKGE